MLIGGVSTVSAAGLPYAGPQEGYILLQDLAMWQDQWGGSLKFLEALTIGDKVTVLGQTAKFKQDGREREYTKIKSLSGKEGWVRSSYIASNATLGVVKVPKSVIYSEARDVKVTSRSVSNLTIVAIFKDGSTGNFIKIGGWDVSQESLLTDEFISKDDVTLDDFDVNAIILYRVAMGQKKAEIKKNLLNLALTKYGRTIFADKIQAILNPDNAVTPAFVVAMGNFIINDNNVNVRNLPDDKTGVALKLLTKDTPVEVIQATANSYTINGVTAQWFHIKDPDGWVFGAFLAPAP